MGLGLTHTSGIKQHGGRGLVAALLATGLVLRLKWLELTETSTRFLDLGEAAHAAVAFAEQGVIADAYFAGQGPTAHVMPVMVAIAAAIFRLFGTNSASASLALTAWSLAQVFASYLLIRQLFRRIGAVPHVLAGGLAILTLVPAHIVQESVDFRYWEGALATCLATLNLLLIIELDQRPDNKRRDFVLVAALTAVTFFVSPTIGLAVDGCWAWFAFRRLSFPRIVQFAGICAAALALVVAPWMLRNQQQLGSPVALRSNFGLELAIANHPGAVSATDPTAAYSARFLELHPFGGPQGAARLRAAGGEVAYSRQLGAEARSWIAEHPLHFSALSLRHYGQFYVPERWQEKLTNWQHWNRPRNDAIGLISLLGLIGLAWGLVRRRPYYGLLAIYIGLAGLPYALVQPIPRYSYVIWGVMAFLTAQLVVDLGVAFRRALQRDRVQSAELDPV